MEDKVPKLYACQLWYSNGRKGEWHPILSISLCAYLKPRDGTPKALTRVANIPLDHSKVRLLAPVAHTIDTLQAAGGTGRAVTFKQRERNDAS